MGSVPVYADEYTLTAESYASDPQNSSAPSLDVNSWLATVPDDMDFDTYQEIMALMYPELADDYEEEDNYERVVSLKKISKNKISIDDKYVFVKLEE